MADQCDFSPDAVEAIARRLCGDPNRRLSTRRELRFGRHGSLSVIPARGVFHDYESGIGGGMLDLVVHAGAASSRGEAAKLLREDGDLPLRETDEDRQRRDREEQAERARRIGVARRLWYAADHMPGTAGEVYLRSTRTIRAPVDLGGLRFSSTAPVAPYMPDSPTCSAIIAAVVDGRGAMTGAHLTYVRADGSGKADLVAQRKMVGIVGGGHIRLLPGARLLVGEGIETAFSAWDAAAVPDLGCAAVLSAGGMTSFQWPAGTTGLVIAFDRDPNNAGETAANRLAARAAAQRLSVDLLPPPEMHNDWNELAQLEARA